MRHLGRIACCVFAAMALSVGAVHAETPKRPRPVGVFTAPAPGAASPHLPARRVYPDPTAPVMVGFPKGEVSQKVLDGLKAGQPERLSVTFDDSIVETQRSAILQREGKRIDLDDAEVQQMKAAGFDAIKVQFLSAYSPGDLRVVQDSSYVPQLTVRIHDLEMLQRLQADPRVIYVGSGDRRMYP